MLPRHEATGASREGGEGGSPESEDLSRSSIAEPLAEGGFRCFVRLSSRRCGSRCARRSPSPERPAARPPRQRPFPVTIVASSGKVTITRRPRRIVSLSPTATETLFAIGAGRQVVAVDDQSDYPKSAPKTALSGLHAERRGHRRLSTGPRRHRVRHEGPREALRRLGIKVVHHDGAKTLKGAYTQIRQLGLVTGTRRRPRCSSRRCGRRSPHRRGAKARARGLAVYHELEPALLGVVEDVHREGVRAARA